MTALFEANTKDIRQMQFDIAMLDDVFDIVFTVCSYKTNTLLHSAKSHTPQRNACYQTLKYQILNKHFQFAFNSLNDYFFQVIFSRKPTSCTKTLHSLEGQSSGSHCLMAFLNLSKSLLFFRLLGTRSHILGPRFEILSVP